LAEEKMKIIYTAAGAPQASTLVRHLRENGEQKVELIGLDMNKEVIGRYISDDFEQIPRAGSENYNQRILEIVQQKKADVFLNCSGADVPHIAQIKNEIEKIGTKVLCPSAEMLNKANNKFSLFTTLSNVNDVNVPEFCSPSNLEEFVIKCQEMGYPKRDLCFKPHISKGSRGFRVLTERFSKRDLLLNHKPTARYMSLDEFINIFKDEVNFPKLLLMEVAEGEEVDAMTIGFKGEALLTTLKSRDSHRWGIIDRGQHIERPELIKSVQAIIREIPLDYNLSIQYIGGKIIEINPRTSTFIYQDNLNEPWLAIKLSLGLIEAEDVKKFQNKIDYNYSMIRYMDQIFIDSNQKFHS
jgi:carbamoyl-phosphate synthase large subunit